MIKKIEFGNVSRQSCLCDAIEEYLCTLFSLFLLMLLFLVYLMNAHFLQILLLAHIFRIFGLEQRSMSIELRIVCAYFDGFVFGTHVNASLYAHRTY